MLIRIKARQPYFRVVHAIVLNYPTLPVCAKRERNADMALCTRAATRCWNAAIGMQFRCISTVGIGSRMALHDAEYAANVLESRRQRALDRATGVVTASTKQRSSVVLAARARAKARRKAEKEAAAKAAANPGMAVRAGRVRAAL